MYGDQSSLTCLRFHRLTPVYGGNTRCCRHQPLKAFLVPSCIACLIRVLLLVSNELARATILTSALPRMCEIGRNEPKQNAAESSRLKIAKRIGRDPCGHQRLQGQQVTATTFAWITGAKYWISSPQRQINFSHKLRLPCHMPATMLKPRGEA